MPNVSATTIIDAPIDHVFSVVSDFAMYPKFLPEIEEAEVLKSTKTGARVAFVMNMMTKINYTLDFKMKKPSAVTWTLVEGEMMESNIGSWKLEKKGAKKTEATFSTEVELSGWIPSSIIDGLMQKSVPAMLEHFKKKAEKA